jgi:hypothetical protein
MLGIWAVAIEAVLGEDGTDVPIEFDGLRFLRDRRGVGALRDEESDKERSDQRYKPVRFHDRPIGEGTTAEYSL